MVDDLEEWHQLPISKELTVKKDMAWDILVIFTDKTKVKFIKANKTVEEVRGHWCCVCRLGYCVVICSVC
jgi:hypothetical protein